MAKNVRRTADAQALYQQALAASLPPAPVAQQTVTVPVEDKGNFITRLFDAEARRHVAIERHNQNVIAEVIHANNLIGSAAADLVAVSLETEASYEQTLEAYRNSKLAMATAPTYIQMAREVFTEGTSRVSRAGINRVAGNIERR